MNNEEINKRTFQLALETIRLVDSLNKMDYINIIIGKQLVRSITSIGANVIEAQSGCSRKDFTNFLNYSLKSSNESIFWLSLIKDSKRSNKEILDELIQETKEIADMLGASILTLKGKRKIV